MLISSFSLAMALYPGRTAPRPNRHRKFARRILAFLGF